MKQQPQDQIEVFKLSRGVRRFEEIQKISPNLTNARNL
jgi:hypothetical protein